MKNVREALKKEFPRAKYAISALGLVPQTATIELTLNGPDQDRVMAEAKKLKITIGNIP